MKKLTPLITVDAIEPLLPFWRDALGLEVTVTVPHPPERTDGPLGFAILAAPGIELMLQTSASIRTDLEGAAWAQGHRQMVDRLEGGLPALFAEVEALDPVLARIEEHVGPPDVVVPRRTTFYGMDEVFILAPGGVLLGLAAKTA